MQEERVVIVGGGFGGITAAKKFKNKPFEVIVIDKMNHHLFQPLLYQVATGALTTSDIAVPIRHILRRQKNTTVVMAEVIGIDKEKKIVHLHEGREISYDYLILAPGANHSYFGHDEWEERAPGLKSIQDAIKIRELILVAFEEAEKAVTLKERQIDLRFAIIGAGPTGVEMSGAIAEIANGLYRDFRKIHPGESEVFLIEAGPFVLPSFPEKLSLKAKEDLEKMGVHVLLNKPVTNITPEGVAMGDEFLEAKTIIWAAGNSASPILKTLNTPLDPNGKAYVTPYLSIEGYPEIFVIGDAARIRNIPVLPGIAPVAIQQANYVAKRIMGGKEKEKIPFKYFDKGMLATIGKAKAVGKVGKFLFSGALAWLVWTFVHIVYLINFRTRFLVMAQWAFWWVTGSRGSRIIPSSIEKFEK